MVLKRNWLLVLIAFIAFSGVLVNYLSRVPQRHYCDYRVYYKAGQDILKGKNIYVRESEEVTPFKYSPFFAFAFAPLSLPPIKASAAIFLAINFILTCLFFKLSFDLAQNSGIVASFSSGKRLLIYALVLLCSFRYILLVWYEGQVSILMCTLVLIALNFLSKEKEAWAGALFAAASLIKYTPAIFLPYLFFQRKFKVILWATFFIGLFLLLPVFMVGLQKEALYLSSWIPSVIATSLDRSSLIDFENQSIYSMFIRFFYHSPFGVQVLSISFDQALLLGRLAALLLYLAVFIPGRSKPADMAINSALLMICMSLFNLNAWMLNFVSLVPAYMLLVQYLMKVNWRDVFILTLFIAAIIISNIMSKDMSSKSVANFGCFYSFTTGGALFLYIALLKLKFSQPYAVPD